MQCWHSEWHEGEYAEGAILCGECGNEFNHKAEVADGGTYSHRCNNWIELWPGKTAHCALPTHTGECLGEVVSIRPMKRNYQNNATKGAPMRIYTDGGYRAEVGGWGWWNQLNKDSDFGFEAPPSSNQRMELMAAKEAMDHYLDEPRLTIVSDSAYLINVMQNNWWKRWEKNGWQNVKGQPVANKDLWEGIIVFLKENPSIQFEKVKGHSGDEGNDNADRLATAGIMEYLGARKKIDELREILHVHSAIYYFLFDNLISDGEWDSMARELVKLQKRFPAHAKEGYEAEEFQDWDGSTGYHLPMTAEVLDKARAMIARRDAGHDPIRAEFNPQLTGAQRVEAELARRAAKEEV